MATRRRVKLLAGFGAVLGMWTTGSGCHLTALPHGEPVPALVRATAESPPVRIRVPDPQPASGIRLASTLPSVIAPRMRLQWSVQSAQLSTGPMTGIGIVGPDGTLQLGPYGGVVVAGLTPAQARLVVERHLARILAHPQVTLRPLTTPQQMDVPWRGVGQGRPAQGSSAIASAWRPVQRGRRPSPTGVAPVAWQTRSPTPDGSDGPPTLSAQPASTFRSVQANESNPSAPELTSSPPAGPIGPTGIPDGPAACPAGPLGPTGPGGPDDQVPRELSKKLLPPYVIEPPDILLVASTQPLKDQPIVGQHAVRPDGTISLGIYGSVLVAGLTLDQARDAVVQVLRRRIKDASADNTSVDVLAYNSKYYYVITDGGGYGEQVYRIPVTGSETVLDALGLIGGLPPVSDKRRIWLARRYPGDHGPEQILPVDWIGITQHGAAVTNYQVLPGDRIYVKADCWRTTDSIVAKVLSPFERILGFTLLGSETVNSILNRH